MLLFDVPTGKRVRIASKRVVWVERTVHKDVALDVTWEGVTTDAFITFKGVRRRLIIDHNIQHWLSEGLWQSNCECEIME